MQSQCKVFNQRFESGYTGNEFLVLDVYLNEKGPSAKTQLLNIFKDHHIVHWSKIKPYSSRP